jgi:hypothetical protein
MMAGYMLLPLSSRPPCQIHLHCPDSRQACVNHGKILIALRKTRFYFRTQTQDPTSHFWSTGTGNTAQFQMSGAGADNYTCFRSLRTRLSVAEFLYVCRSPIGALPFPLTIIHLLSDARSVGYELRWPMHIHHSQVVWERNHILFHPL